MLRGSIPYLSYTPLTSSIWLLTLGAVIPFVFPSWLIPDATISP